MNFQEIIDIIGGLIIVFDTGFVANFFYNYKKIKQKIKKLESETNNKVEIQKHLNKLEQDKIEEYFKNFDEKLKIIIADLQAKNQK